MLGNLESWNQLSPKLFQVIGPGHVIYGWNQINEQVQKFKSWTICEDIPPWSREDNCMTSSPRSDIIYLHEELIPTIYHMTCWMARNCSGDSWYRCFINLMHKWINDLNAYTVHGRHRMYYTFGTVFANFVVHTDLSRYYTHHNNK